MLKQIKKSITDHTDDTFRKKSWRVRLFKAASHELFPPLYLWIGLLLLALFTLLPFLYLLTSSFSETQELISGHLFPHHPTLENYKKLFTGSTSSDFINAMKNSVLTASLTTFFTLIIGVFAAYALAKIKFPLRMSTMFGILSIQLLPSISIIVPMYIMMRNGVTVNIPFTSIELIHTPPLLDSIWSLVIAYSTFSLPFSIWLMTGYFRTISREMEEASFVDGCSRIGSMIRIVIPLSLPGIAATAIFTFLNAWDEFMFASAFTQTYDSKTLPIAIREFIGKHSIDWGLMTAGGLIASLPPVVISLFLYRYIVSGLSAGGVKE
ncbi:MAG TPA: carbohydrate ABC transporter permease [Bacilli bacterium]